VNIASRVGRPHGPVSVIAGGNPPGAQHSAREPSFTKKKGVMREFAPRMAGEFAHG